MTSEPTYAALLGEGHAQLERAGIAGAALDARILLEFASRCDHTQLIARSEEHPSAEAIQKYSDALEQRRRRVPLAYIIGAKEFWSLTFQVNAATLIPRPESEHLVEEALKLFPERATPGRVLDLGTGSGCLLISILSERPNLFGVGIDLSIAALQVAAENSRRHGVAGRAAFLQGDWAQAITGAWDLIVCNPPYLSAGELEAAQPEVREHEPHLALSPGTDGLDAFRKIAPALHDLLKPRGVAVLEIGSTQPTSVSAILESAGLGSMTVRPDLAGLPRVLIAQKTLTNKQARTSKKRLESTS